MFMFYILYYAQIGRIKIYVHLQMYMKKPWLNSWSFRANLKVYNLSSH